MTDTSSTIVNRTLRRLPNSAYRVREYLTEKEVDRLIEAARKWGRNAPRDAAAYARARVMGSYISNRNVCAQTWNLFNDDRCTLSENWTISLATTGTMAKAPLS
jgi:hypothetical protein